MTKELKSELTSRVLSSIINDEKVKIYFKLTTRPPMIGRFVATNDFEEMDKKGMYRFVTEPGLDAFRETEHTMYTKIFDIQSLTYILKA